MPRFREKKRLREQRILGITLGLPDEPYQPTEVGALRGFKLVFYDPSDVKLGEMGTEIKDGRISEVNFELMSLGCASFNFICDDEPPFSIDYRTRVDIYPYFDSVPWFTGFIQTLPQTGKKRPYEYTGFGFYEQLDWVAVTETYSSQEISLIVKDIVQNIVAPNTQIIYNVSKVETTSYTTNAEIDFYLVTAKEALQTLADMATGYEFGVDDDREFYFRAIDTSVYHSFWAGKHCQDIEIQENPHTVRNKLYIKVGLIQGEGKGYIKEGANCIGYESDATSISTYGLREAVVTAPETLDEDDAREWAKDLLATLKNPEITARIKTVILDETRAKIEAEGKARLTTYEGSEYILFLKRIQYSLSSAGITAEIDLD